MKKQDIVKKSYKADFSKLNSNQVVILTVKNSNVEYEVPCEAIAVSKQGAIALYEALKEPGVPGADSFGVIPYNEETVAFIKSDKDEVWFIMYFIEKGGSKGGVYDNFFKPYHEYKISFPAETPDIIPQIRAMQQANAEQACIDRVRNIK